MAQRVTAWVGWIWFAGIVMFIAGILNFFYGLAAVLGPDKGYVAVNGKLLILNIDGWGWAHLIFGIIVAVVGLFVLTGQAWARITAIVLVALNVITQFLWLPVQPWWSLIVIILDFFVLWALIVHGEEAERV
ncbi:hypothetical protein ACFT5B_10640 [Luteimicrobium sp. NPDC057192]|jgi:hypothetical protein|uniref:DUF7144 family membrane protein n=1 Tax=Luteimicrobium sp. NPDC057192 TaxID=3346042 RepID=UPI002CF60D19|nr:hypothetical protein [Luteimicrobium sp.]